MRIAARTPRGAVAGCLFAGLLGLLAWAAPAAQAAQTAPTTQAAAAAARPGHVGRPASGAVYTWSKLTWTGADTGLAATDAIGNLYYFWQAAGSTKWHKQTVAVGGTGPGYDYYTPAIVSAGTGGVGLMAVDYYGNLDYWWHATGTSTWTYEQVAAANDFRYESPSIAVTSSGVVISAGYSFGDLMSFYQQYGSVTWSRQVVASDPSGGDTYAGSSIAVNSDGIGIADNYEGTISEWFEPDNSANWTEQAITSSATGDPVTVAVYGDDMVIAGIVQLAFSDANEVVTWTQTPGEGWVGKSLHYDGTSDYHDPQISGGSVSMIVTAFNGNGGLRYWRIEGAGSPWTWGMVAPGGRGTDDRYPSAILTPTAAMVSAVNQVTGNLIAWSQPDGSSTWTKQRVANG